MRAREEISPPRARGATLLEVVVAGGLLAGVALASLSLVSAGAGRCRDSVAEEVATNMAGRLLDRMTVELKDAPASLVVVSSAQPGRIAFQRMVAYDPTIATAPPSGGGGGGGLLGLVGGLLTGLLGSSGQSQVAAAAGRKLVSTEIAYSMVAVPSRAGSTFAVERDETGAPSSQLGAFVAAQDLDTPGLPGLNFDLDASGPLPVLTVAVTVSYAASGASPVVVKRSASIALEVP